MTTGSDDHQAEKHIASLDEARALVVGANGGIGQGIVAALASAGCVVAASDLQPHGAKGSVADAYIEADLTDEDAARRLFREATDRLGRIDVVVNSAGIGHVDALESLPLDVWRKVFAVNVEAALLVSQLAARQMSSQEISSSSDRRGLIIHISSQAAEVGRPLSAAYGASKAALNHLAKSFAATFAEQRISTTVVAPGAVAEGMLRYLLPEIERVGGKEEVESRNADGVLFGVDQSPADMGAFVTAVAAQPGMTMNGVELWTTPTRGPIA